MPSKREQNINFYDMTILVLLETSRDIYGERDKILQALRFSVTSKTYKQKYKQ